MKRGYIAWDKQTLPPAELAARLEGIHRLLADRDLPALVVYTDVWRSNDVRYVSNYMPYWNRALTVVAQGEPPLLLCALSPRVYPWIKSVTTHETIIASPNLPAQLEKLCTERGWRRLAVVDFDGLPADLRGSLSKQPTEWVNIARRELRPAPTAGEIHMHAQAAALARDSLAAELPAARELNDFQLTGRLERVLRHAGAEDVVVLISDGVTPPVPARGRPVTDSTSVVVALEYQGHWGKVARNLRGATAPLLEANCVTELLSGNYAWEVADPAASGVAVVALCAQIGPSGERLFYGDTCVRRNGGVERL